MLCDLGQTGPFLGLNFIQKLEGMWILRFLQTLSNMFELQLICTLRKATRQPSFRWGCTCFPVPWWWSCDLAPLLTLATEAGVWRLERAQWALGPFRLG